MVHILYKIPLVPYTELLRGVDTAIILGAGEISSTEDADFFDAGRVTGVIDLSGSNDRLAAFLDFDVVTASAFISADESYLLADADTVIAIAEFDTSESIDGIDQDTVVSTVSASADDALNSEFNDATIIVTASVSSSEEGFDATDSASEVSAAIISATEVHSGTIDADTVIGAAADQATEFATFADNLAQALGRGNPSAAELVTWLDSATDVSSAQIFTTFEGHEYIAETTTLTAVAEITGIDSAGIAISVAVASATSPAADIDLSVVSSAGAATASAPTPTVTYAFFDAALVTSGDVPASAPTEPSLAQLPQLDLVASDAGTDLFEPIDIATVSGTSVITTNSEAYNTNRVIGVDPAHATASSPIPSVTYAFIDSLIFIVQGQPATAPTTTTLAQVTKVGLETTGSAVDLFD